MNTKINTVNVKLDINPSLWIADQRIQCHLPPQHVRAYMNLICHAMTLHATTGSEYINGEFSLARACKRVPHLSQKAIDQMAEAELLSQIDGDRWAVEFPNEQTPHDQLQAAANQRQRAGETRKAHRAEEKQAAVEEAERQARKREQNAQRQQEYRERQAATPEALPELTPLAERGKQLVHDGVYSSVTVPNDGEPPF